MQLGLLTGKIKPGQHFNARDLRSTNRLFKPEAVTKVNGFLHKIRPLAEVKNASLGQLALAWTLAPPGITVALVGARHPAQATQNTRAMDVKLSFEEVDFISKQLAQEE